MIATTEQQPPAPTQLLYTKTFAVGATGIDLRIYLLGLTAKLLPSALQEARDLFANVTGVNVHDEQVHLAGNNNGAFLKFYWSARGDWQAGETREKIDECLRQNRETLIKIGWRASRW